MRSPWRRAVPAQTTDKRVNLTTPVLFAKYPARRLAATPSEDVEEDPRPTRFFQGEGRRSGDGPFRGAAGPVRRRWVPADLNEMVTAPGAGLKTANVVLGNITRHPRHHRGHPLPGGCPGGSALDDEAGRAGQGGGGSRRAVPARSEWSGSAVALADLARPAGSATPVWPILRRVCPVADWCPSFGLGADGRGDRGREAREGRPVLVTQAPQWLRDLAAAAAGMDVPGECGRPASGGRRSAVLVLFGAGPHGPDLLYIQRNEGLRRHAGQPAFPGGAIEDSDDVAGWPPPSARRPRRRDSTRQAWTCSGPSPSCSSAVGDFRVVPVLAWWRERCPRCSRRTPGRWPRSSGSRWPELADPAHRFMFRHPGVDAQGLPSTSARC